jgi:hypothetical protein
VAIPPEGTTEVSNGKSGQIPKLPTTLNFLPYSSLFPQHLNIITLEKKQCYENHFRGGRVDNDKIDIQEVGCGVWTGFSWLRIETGGSHL